MLETQGTFLSGMSRHLVQFGRRSRAFPPVFSRAPARLWDSLQTEVALDGSRITTAATFLVDAVEDGEEQADSGTDSDEP